MFKLFHGFGKVRLEGAINKRTSFSDAEKVFLIECRVFFFLILFPFLFLHENQQTSTALIADSATDTPMNIPAGIQVIQGKNIGKGIFSKKDNQDISILGLNPPTHPLPSPTFRSRLNRSPLPVLVLLRLKIKIPAYERIMQVLHRIMVWVTVTVMVTVILIEPIQIITPLLHLVFMNTIIILIL
jgi:hypothetical protein